MARARRTRFAASFVAVIAAGCSHETPPTTPGSGTATGSGTASAPTPVSKTPTSTWSVNKDPDGVCWAEPHVECDPAVVHHTCNPPAPMRITCPSPMPADGFRIVSFDGKTCEIEDTHASIACPSYDTQPAAFTPRAWTIVKNGDKCTATLDGSTTVADVDCSGYYAGGTVREETADHCMSFPAPMHCPKGAHCNPPGPREVKCP